MLSPLIMPAGMPPPAKPAPAAPAAANETSQTQPSVPTPENKSLPASFEEIETVSAHTEIDEHDKQAAQKFAFPPLSFRWRGRPEDLAPAFIWQSPSLGYHLGDRKVPAGEEGDELLSQYSATLAIKMTGTDAVLRMHLNVITRLRAWVEEVRPELRDQALVIVVEPRGRNEVTLRMPAVGSRPARTIMVGV
ncbi:hypothetical protein [Lacunisphaera limnophila]|uniref:hypothetical protein n=1 Tax=Lacunisphaera limnophila TaxID=1838286 RepID=UPI0012FDD2FE|nr:hypothetical protein [Lacunisphaera limnophila]